MTECIDSAAVCLLNFPDLFGLLSFFAELLYLGLWQFLNVLNTRQQFFKTRIKIGIEDDIVVVLGDVLRQPEVFSEEPHQLLRWSIISYLIR